MKKISFVLAFITLVSCSSPLQKTYSKDAFEKDMAEIMKAYKDDKAVMASMTQMSLDIKADKDQHFAGKSYKEIITDIEKKKQAIRDQIMEKLKKKQ